MSRAPLGPENDDGVIDHVATHRAEVPQAVQIGRAVEAHRQVPAGKENDNRYSTEANDTSVPRVWGAIRRWW